MIPVRLWLIAGAVAGLLALGWGLDHRGYTRGVEAQRAVYEAAAVKARAASVVAREKAAVQRAADEATTRKLELDLTNAVANLPDSTPSVRRAALGCARLRASGRDVSKLPVCR